MEIRNSTEINKMIMGSEGSIDLCTLMDARVAEFDSCNVATAFRKLLKSQRDGMPRGVVDRALQSLEAAALQKFHTFNAQEVVNTLHILEQTKLATTPSFPLRCHRPISRCQTCCGRLRR